MNGFIPHLLYNLNILNVVLSSSSSFNLFTYSSSITQLVWWMRGMELSLASFRIDQAVIQFWAELWSQKHRTFLTLTEHVHCLMQKHLLRVHQSGGATWVSCWDRQGWFWKLVSHQAWNCPSCSTYGWREIVEAEFYESPQTVSMQHKAAMKSWVTPDKHQRCSTNNMLFLRRSLWVQWKGFVWLHLHSSRKCSVCGRHNIYAVL